MNQDFSLFGWFLPKQYMDLLIVPVIISFIGYIILFIVIRKLMKRFLNSKPWHKYVRRGIWISILTLMFFDPVYYYFWIEHGMCKADRERIYPAPPASYVIAGPMSSNELEKFNVSNSLVENEQIRTWSCYQNSRINGQFCMVKNIKHDSEDKPILFGFVRSSFFEYDIQDNRVRYSESYKYETDGHWLTRFLFGYKIKWIASYEKIFSCAKIFDTGQVPINIKE